MKTELISSEFLMALGCNLKMQDKMVEKITLNIAEHRIAAPHSV